VFRLVCENGMIVQSADCWKSYARNSCRCGHSCSTLGGPSGKVILLLPTTEPFTALAACGGDYGPDGLGRPDVVT
jgi:hypothetical protein